MKAIDIENDHEAQILRPRFCPSYRNITPHRPRSQNPLHHQRISISILEPIPLDNPYQGTQSSACHDIIHENSEITKYGGRGSSNLA
jgi:hypothetical protein